MSYTLLTVRSTEDDDDRLYPVPTMSSPPVRLDASDGAPTMLRATCVAVYEQVSGGSKQLLKLTDVDVAVTITSTRVAISCTKYDKGGGWRGLGAGGLAVATVANGVSKARAAHRRAGKALVGHVRYPWLRIVGYNPKRGWGTHDQLRLGVSLKTVDGTIRPLLVDLTTAAHTDVAEQAQHIVRAAAQHRLQHWRPEGDKERGHLEDLLLAQRLATPPPGQFALYSLPGYYYVSNNTARPAPPMPSRPE